MFDNDIGIELKLIGQQGDLEEMVSRLDELVKKYGYTVALHGPLNRLRALHYEQQQHLIGPAKDSPVFSD